MTFDELIHELECDYGRINFRERLMLRRAYDVVPEKELEAQIREDRLCEHCDQYKSYPDGKRCRTCDNGSKWKRG